MTKKNPIRKRISVIAGSALGVCACSLAVCLALGVFSAPIVSGLTHNQVASSAIGTKNKPDSENVVLF